MYKCIMYKPILYKCIVHKCIMDKCIMYKSIMYNCLKDKCKIYKFIMYICIMFNNSNLQGYEVANVQMYKVSNVQMYKCTLQSSTNLHIYLSLICKCTTLLLLQAPSSVYILIGQVQYRVSSLYYLNICLSIFNIPIVKAIKPLI